MKYQCPRCKSSDTFEIGTKQRLKVAYMFDLKTTNRGVPVRECNRCGEMFLAPRPKISKDQEELL